MSRYFLTRRYSLVVISMIGLLVLAGLVAIQRDPLIFQPGGKQVQSNSMIETNLVETMHPADRKFLTDQYMGWQNIDPLANVHPADRKFFLTDNHTVGQIKEPLAVVHPADRKFYNGWYAPSTGISSEAAPPAVIHPADHKFYNGW